MGLKVVGGGVGAQTYHCLPPIKKVGGKFYFIHRIAIPLSAAENQRRYRGCREKRRNRRGRKEGHVLFNDALSTFYLRLYGVRHMVKDHSDSEKGNPLPPLRLYFPISSVSFICTIPQTG